MVPDCSAPVLERRCFATLRVVVALILREMSTRYGRTPGGYIWAVLEPIGIISALAVGFSLLVPTPSLGRSFLLFYATGFIPFQVYQSVAGTVARAIQFSRPLLLYPSVTWIDALLARGMLNGLTTILVGYMIFAGILLSSSTGAVIDIGSIVLSFALAGLLGFAVGVMNCFLMGVFSAWDVVWSIATRPLFLISGVFFTYEDLPAQVQGLVWFNPLVHIVGLMREGFYPMYSTPAASVVFVVFVAMPLMAAGMVLLRRFHKDIINA